MWGLSGPFRFLPLLKHFFLKLSVHRINWVCHGWDWQLLHPTGRWFWLWRRDLAEPVPLAHTWTPAAAAVAPVIFTALVTPVQTRSHTDRHTSQEGRRHVQQTIRDGGGTVPRIFPSAFPFFPMPKGARSYPPRRFQKWRRINCAQLHSFSSSPPIMVQE